MSNKGTPGTRSSHPWGFSLSSLGIDDGFLDLLDRDGAEIWFFNPSFFRCVKRVDRTVIDTAVTGDALILFPEFSLGHHEVVYRTQVDARTAKDTGVIDLDEMIEKRILVCAIRFALHVAKKMRKGIQTGSYAFVLIDDARETFDLPFFSLL